MIDAIIADHQELLRAGLVEVLSWKTLKRSIHTYQFYRTDFLPVFPKIERMLKRRKTAAPRRGECPG